jgi:hypothetical protein
MRPLTKWLITVKPDRQTSHTLPLKSDFAMRFGATKGLDDGGDDDDDDTAWPAIQITRGRLRWSYNERIQLAFRLLHRRLQTRKPVSTCCIAEAPKSAVRICTAAWKWERIPQLLPVLALYLERRNGREEQQDLNARRKCFTTTTFGHQCIHHLLHVSQTARSSHNG